MSTRAKLAGVVVLAAAALATWRFLSSPAEAPRVDAVQRASEPAAAAPSLVETPEPAAGPHPLPPAKEEPAPKQSGSAESPPAALVAEPNTLDERTLVGTKWERDGFGIEFGADGNLLIGGRQRAKWRVEGSRIRLYRDTTGEEHWLDIVGIKLMWEGQEIGRVR